MKGGSVQVTPSPVIMDKAVFRHGSSLTRSLLQRNSGTMSGGSPSIARCLFGPPDTKQSKDLVREVELKNALNFGKRFNFDIVNGEPFPSAKKMKFSYDDSDEENVISENSSQSEDSASGEGFEWTDKYTEDHMALCNKHALSTSIVGPNRTAAVSLLFAPIILHSNHPFSSFASSKSVPVPTATVQESPQTCNNTPKSQEASSSSSTTVTCPSSPLNEVPASETNNNIIPNKSHSKASSVLERRINRLNAQHSHSHQQPSAKKSSSLSTAQNILTKYTNRVVKHAVIKKPIRKSIITGNYFFSLPFTPFIADIGHTLLTQAVFFLSYFYSRITSFMPLLACK